MSRSIEEALTDCLERMRADGMTPEEALELYPALRDELEPLLALSAEIDSLPRVQAPPSLRTYKRPVFRTAPAREAWWRRWLPLGAPSFGWSAPLARVAIALGLFIATSGGAVVASANSLPDEPLYSVKLAVENAELALAPNQQARADLELKLAAKRLKEVEIAAQQGRSEAVARGAELYKEKANAVASAASSSESEEVEETLRHNIEVLTEVQKKVQNPQAREAIGAAISRAEERSTDANGQNANGQKEKDEDKRGKPEQQAPAAVIASTPTATAIATATATPEPTKSQEPPGKATGRPEQPGNAPQSTGQGTGTQDQGQSQGQGQGQELNQGQGQSKAQGQGPRLTPTPVAATSTPSVEPSIQREKPSQSERSIGQQKQESEGKDEVKNPNKAAQEDDNPVSSLLKELRRLVGRS